MTHSAGKAALLWHLRMGSLGRLEGTVSTDLVSLQRTSSTEATERHLERVYGQTRKHQEGELGDLVSDAASQAGRLAA